MTEIREEKEVLDEMPPRFTHDIPQFDEQRLRDRLSPLVECNLPDEVHEPTSQVWLDYELRWTEEKGAMESSPTLNVLTANEQSRIKNMTVEMESIVPHIDTSTPVPYNSPRQHELPSHSAEEVIDLTLTGPALVEQDPRFLAPVPRTWQVLQRHGAGSSARDGAER